MSVLEDEILKRWCDGKTELHLVLSSEGLYCVGMGSIRKVDDVEMIIDAVALEMRLDVRSAKKVFSHPADAPAVIRERVQAEQICQVELQLPNLNLLLTEQRTSF